MSWRLVPLLSVYRFIVIVEATIGYEQFVDASHVPLLKVVDERILCTEGQEDSFPEITTRTVHHSLREMGWDTCGNISGTPTGFSLVTHSLHQGARPSGPNLNEKARLLTVLRIGNQKAPRHGKHAHRVVLCQKCSR